MKKLFILLSVVFVQIIAQASAQDAAAKSSVKLIHAQNLRALDLHQPLQGLLNLDSSQDARNFILEFSAPITTQMKSQFSNFKFLRYLPDHSWIVRTTQSALQSSVQTLKSLGLKNVYAYNADLKVSVQARALAVLRNGTNPYLIHTFSESDAQSLKLRLPADAVSDPSKGRFVEAHLDLQTVKELVNANEVEWLEPVSQMQPMIFEPLDEIEIQADQPTPDGDFTDLTGFETGTKLMGFEEAWKNKFTGKDQIVAVADTGLDMGILEKLSKDFSSALVDGQKFGLGASDWGDPMGHGTHVSGSIVMRGEMSEGQLLGGANGAGLIAQGMWSPILDNLTVPPQLKKLFEPAYNKGARIHSNSWGSPANLGAYDGNAIQVDEYMWNHPDFLVIFAAGNSGVDANRDGVIDHGSVSSPGTAKNALTVGASENSEAKGGIQKMLKDLRGGEKNWGVEPLASSKISDNPGGLAMFSSRGPTQDGRIKPEIVAPGTNILSSFSHVTGASPMWGQYNKDFSWAGGTSMATPLTAGAAAVTRQAIQEKLSIKEPSSAMLKAVMMIMSKDLYPGQFGGGTEFAPLATQEIQTLRPNPDEGFGRVDLTILDQLGKTIHVIEDAEGVAQGEEKSVELKLKRGRDYEILLVYTDAPGSSQSQKSLINNIDLDLVQKLKKSTKVVAKGVNDVDNFEFIKQAVRSRSPDFSVKIKGTNVPVPSPRGHGQPFVIVYKELPKADSRH